MAPLGRLRGALRPAAPIALIAVLAAGCASAGTASTDAKAGAASSAAPTGGGPADRGGRSGMNRAPPPAPPSSAAASAEAAAAGDVKPVPTQQLGTAVWQGGRITADAMTPVPFLIFNGPSMQEVKPPKNTRFHPIVLLNGGETNGGIPYASGWGTIT